MPRRPPPHICDTRDEVDAFYDDIDRQQEDYDPADERY